MRAKLPPVCRQVAGDAVISGELAVRVFEKIQQAASRSVKSPRAGKAVEQRFGVLPFKAEPNRQLFRQKKIVGAKRLSVFLVADAARDDRFQDFMSSRGET